jgi:DNA-binding PadR family transcriptional regulator
MSTLGYALLGLLARGPHTGYELTGLMREPVGFFWAARHSQIYPELARLEERGLVTHEVVEQQERPDKKVYSITAAGREALREWLAEPVRERPVRDELVLKAYSLWMADPKRAVALFREQEARHAERLRRYEELRSWMEREWGEDLERVDSPRFAGYAALWRGIGYEREYVEWCRWLAGKLEGER